MKKQLASLLLLVITLSAAHSALLKNKTDIPYYGEFFYKNLVYSQQKDTSSLKDVLFNILSLKHNYKEGHYDIISSNCQTQNCYSHRSLTYSQARQVVLKQLDRAKDGYVRDVYCGFKIAGRDLDNSSIMNIEHTWPQSKFTNQFRIETQKADLHHLYPTDSQANSKRGNHPFAEVEDKEEATDNCSNSFLGVAIPIPGTSRRPLGDYFEPAKPHRGNVARAMFYFSVKYKLPIDPVQEYYLKKWNQEDPVDQAEMERNEAIYKIQGTRNPFVDFPKLAYLIKDF